MHPLHDYIASQISERLKDRGVVVMYDKREELRPFFSELAGSAYVDGTLIHITVGKQNAKLYVFDGSFLKVRFTVEAITNGDQPEQLVIYVPSLDRDTKGSLLMELEKAGTFYSQPALKQFARLVLRKRYTDVAIDDMLKSDSLTYTDLARMAQAEQDALATVRRFNARLSAKGSVWFCLDSHKNKMKYMRRGHQERLFLAVSGYIATL